MPLQDYAPRIARIGMPASDHTPTLQGVTIERLPCAHPRPSPLDESETTAAIERLPDHVEGDGLE